VSSLGFSEKEIHKFSSQTSWILRHLEEKLNRNVYFLVKSLGLPLDDIVIYSCLFSYKLETRIIPRYRVMEALKSMKLLKTERISPHIVKLTEKRFLLKYVNRNAESSSVLWDIYYGGKAGKADH